MDEILKKRMNSRWIGKLLVVVIALSVSGATLAFWIVGKRVEKSLSEQMLHRQQIVARAGAKSIEDFLRLVGTSVSSYAALEEVALDEESAQERLNLFVEEWVGTAVFSVALTDEEGNVVYSANKQGAGERGPSLADRDYFLWSRDSAQLGQVFVGEAVYGRFGSVKDQFLLPVAAGVFSEEEHRGVLIATVVLSELTETYLDPLRIDEETRIYLIDNAGVMLYAPQEKFIGANYFNYLAKVDYRGKGDALKQLWGAVKVPEEGKIDAILPNERSGDLDRFLISYSPVKYQDGEYLTLAVVSPIDTALVFFPQFNYHQLGVLIFAILVVIALSSLSILALRLVQREAFYEGFTKGREHAKKKKSK